MHFLLDHNFVIIATIFWGILGDVLYQVFWRDSYWYFASGWLRGGEVLVITNALAIPAVTAQSVPSIFPGVLAHILYFFLLSFVRLYHICFESDIIKLLSRDLLVV